MTVLPLIDRELRVRSRSGATYWSRFGAALVGMLVCLPALVLSSQQVQQRNIGPGVFTGLVSAAFLLCCSSCLLTADSISSERREGTLGLLFLTRVRHADVLFGKLASVGTNCVFLLVAFLPLLAVPIIAGGVTGGEVVRSSLALLGALFLALSVGLWASARHVEKGKAVRTAVLLAVMLVIVPWIGGQLFAAVGTSGGDQATALVLASPLVTLMQATDRAYRLSPTRYWLSLVFVAVAALGFVGGALWSLRRRLRYGFAEDEKPIDISPDTLNPHPIAPSRPPRMSPRDAERPLHWLIRRQRGIRWPIWCGTVIAALSSLLFSWLTGISFSRMVGGFSRSVVYFTVVLTGLSLTIHAIQTALFAWAISRFFVESRRSGELELLLTMPGVTQQIVPAQWGALKRLFLWPVVVMLTAQVLRSGLTLLDWASHGGGDSWYAGYLAVTLPLNMISTIVSLYALGRVALWSGMRASNHARAVLWTLMWVTGFPYVISLLVQVLSSFLLGPLYSALGGSSRASIVSWVMNLMYFIPYLLFFLWLGRFARVRLDRLLPGAEFAPFSLSKSLPKAMMATSNAIRTARHWTPSP